MELTYENIYGKTMLVKLSCFSPTGEEVGSSQIFGEIIAASENGILLQTEDELYTLPPDLSSTTVAEKGVYTLEGSGVMIQDPDLTAEWAVCLSDQEI